MQRKTDLINHLTPAQKLIRLSNEAFNSGSKISAMKHLSFHHIAP
jgi:Zn-dependent membrane protease YugP